MNRKLAGLVILLVCAAAVGGYFFYRSRHLSPAAMWKRLPTRDALVCYIDFAGLRRAGLMQLLDNARTPEEPDYQAFVRSTGFNYRNDLDSVMASFGPTGRFILAKGRFDWSRLRSYAESSQGRCEGSVCRMPGSTPDRRISYLPIHSGLMALAVSTDDSAAVRLTSASSTTEPKLPGAPAWISLPPAMLASVQNLPDGTRPFARAVSESDSVTLSLVPEEKHFALLLDVVCHSDQQAYDASAQLTKVTDLLRRLIVQQNAHPNPGDLSGVLVSGTFHNTGNRVNGHWPIERVFIENLMK